MGSLLPAFLPHPESPL